MTEKNARILLQIFKEVFERSEGEDVKDLRQVSESAWDSLTHVTLVAAIESEFAIRIETDESLEMTSFAATELLLTEKGL
jgi:acyl carrier protein